MRKSALFFSALVCALSSSLAAHGASVCDSVSGNLVQNCGFETGDFTGWTLKGNLQGGTPNAPTNYYIYVDGSNPHSGNYAAVLGAQSTYGQTGSGDMYGPPTMLSQTLAVAPNKSYNLSFYLGESGCSVTDSNCGGYFNSFAVSFNGQVLGSYKNFPDLGGDYLFGFSPLSTGPSGNSGVLEFDFTNDDGQFYLDDVAVTATPEPSSLMLLGTGMAGLIGAAKRRAGRLSGRK